MDLERVFKRSLYAVTALAACILGAAEGGAIPYGTFVAVVFGYLWTESRTRDGQSRGRGMNDALAAVLGVLALLAAFREFRSPNIEGRLLSGTHLLVYLSWIVLVQPKTNRRYWWLLALGILQVAVASVLASGQETIWFGMGAITYIFATIWTLAVFSIHRSASQFAVRPATTNTSELATSGVSVSIGAVRIEDGVTWINAPFVAGIAFNCAASLFVSVLFFLLIPRVWIPGSAAYGSEESSIPGVSRSAFTTEIRLGDMGAILESLDPVMQVRLKTPDNQPIAADEYAHRIGMTEPLFRGAVLGIYHSPAWRVEPVSVQRPSRLIAGDKRTLVRQEIRLEDSSADALFALGYPMGLVDPGEHPRGSYQSLTGLIYRSPDFNKGTIRYVVYSEFPPAGVRLNAVQSVTEVVRQRYAQVDYLERHTHVPRRLVRLSQLARDVVEQAQQRRGTPLSDLEKARAIESYLRDSGTYTYTLTQSISDPKIDPVEDFLFNRKEGHCEYFASALTLMLRAANIPSRLISGYKGGAYDEPSHTLFVQKRHAHAWCEAWIERRGWVTLDATPADERLAMIEAASTNRSVWTDMRSQLAGIWSENVVNISLEKQEEVIYGPIREIIQAAVQSLKDLWDSPQNSLAAFFAALTDPRSWFSISGVGVLLLLAVAGWLLHRMGRRFAGWTGWQQAQVDRQRVQLIAFYERFVTLMGSQGLRRLDNQTQQEFANEAAMTLHPHLQSAGLTNGPAEISDLFYQVRFGDRVLPEVDVRRVDELISHLERTLQPHSD